MTARRDVKVKGEDKESTCEGERKKREHSNKGEQKIRWHERGRSNENTKAQEYPEGSYSRRRRRRRRKKHRLKVSNKISI